MTGWLENEPYPGVRECLQALQGAGKRMYVATSKLETMARQVLAHFDMLQYFAGVCGGSAEDPEAGKKVNVVRRVLRENGTDDLSRAVLSGDREYDILGGHQAGVQTIGVLYGYGSRRPRARTSSPPPRRSCRASCWDNKEQKDPRRHCPRGSFYAYQLLTSCRSLR